MSKEDHVASALAKSINPLVTIFSFTFIGFIIMRYFSLQGIWAALDLFFFSVLGLVFAVLDPFLRSRSALPSRNKPSEKPINEDKLREFLKNLDDEDEVIQ